jgi:hypothetical protein
MKRPDVAVEITFARNQCDMAVTGVTRAATRDLARGPPGPPRKVVREKRQLY